MSGLPDGTLLLLPAAFAVAIGFVLIAQRRPRFGIGVWLLSVAFVPVWCGVSISYYFSPASLVGIGLVVALIALPPRTFGLGDLLMSFFFVACLAPMIAGGSTVAAVFAVLSQWVVGYTIGRLAPGWVSVRWIYSFVAVVFTVAAAGAIVEFTLNWHAFETLGPLNALHSEWGPIQERGGIFRSEGAFGHSIALGSSIALAIPLTLSSPFRPLARILMTAVMLGGVVVTFSRTSLLCTALGLALTLLFVRTGAVRRVRAAAWGLIVAGAIGVLPYMFSVFAEAGDEASGSAEYRGKLTDLIPTLDIIGMSSSAHKSPTGVLRFGGFRSIDSQILLTGLTYGALAMACGIVLLVLASFLVLSGRATPPLVAIVAQIPSLVTVALITQYSIFVWFVAGLAVASCVAAETDEAQPPDRAAGGGRRPIGGGNLHRPRTYSTMDLAERTIR